MGFDSGRVTFCRFRVRGDGPATVDGAFLSILQEAAFVEHEAGLGTPDEVEAGFVTGVHLFDTRFGYEKNGYGPGGSVAVFALRLDTHKVPGEVKRAYKKINEAAAAEDNPTGYASKREKREAAEAANEQARAELASGKYRKSKVVPLLWDLRSGTMYCGASGTTVIEHLVRQMRQAFAVELDYLSAGVLAADLIKAEGRSRDYEDLHPSAFTDPPAGDGGGDADDDGPGRTAVPAVPWVAKAVDLKDFLGNEFLMWLWWTVETRGGNVDTGGGSGSSGGSVFVAIDKALDMDCAWERTGKQTLRGENPTRLPEAADALATGKWVRKAGLIVADAEHQWELTLQGDAMTVGSAALPGDEGDEKGAATPREAVERRVGLILELAGTLDGLYGAFLKRRASGPWSSDRDAMRRWIVERRRPQRAVAAAREPAMAL